jgi:nicotinamide-nucleotide amidase
MRRRARLQAYETRGEAVPQAVRLGATLEAHGLTLALAESVTGGALTEALVPVAGSSSWLTGGVTAYMERVKREVLGVSAERVVSGDAAQEMAKGVARLLSAEVGLATTGCAGPEPMEDQPVGTLWIGISAFDRATALHLRLDGSPEEVRARAVRAALVHAADRLERMLELPVAGVDERLHAHPQSIAGAPRVGDARRSLAFD